MSILDNIERFMLDQIAIGVGIRSLAPDEDLLDLGLIDSLGIMKLIVFIEDSFGVRIEDSEIVPENFQSLSRMARFVEQKSAA